MELLTKYFPEITDEQMNCFSRLPALYAEWNEKINVISRKDMDHLIERHVLHSLAIAKYLPLKSGWWVADLGTGGGFPGIPLAIMFPDVKFHLIDSVGKKIKVVEAISKELQLKNVKSVWGRVEQQPLKVNLVVTRAVAPLRQLVEWSAPLLKTQSRGIIALKGGDLDAELQGFKKKTKVVALNTFFEEPFFESKSLIHYQP